MKTRHLLSLFGLGIALFGATQITLGDDTSTQVSSSNVAPAFTSATDDASNSTTPTNNGSTVTFTATATDSNSDNYYLLVCAAGDTATANNNAAPSCSGTQICVSSSTATGVQTTCTSAAVNTASETVAWTSFVCDYNSSSLCSAAENTNSPYSVNHRPSFSSVTTDDGTAGTIEPGDTVRVSATLADTDTDGVQDQVTMVVCQSGDTFNYSSPGDGTTTSGCSSGISGEYCRSTTAVPGSHSCNLPSILTSIPTAHGSYGFEVFVYDHHNFGATTSSSYTYTVQDVAPVVDSITLTGDGSGNFDLTAATTTSFAWSAAIHDNNGDGDIVSASGKIFDTGASMTNACDPSASNTNAQQECYEDTVCTLGSVSTPGSGKTATGTDAGATASCDTLVYFNANASASWKGSLSAVDGSTTTTTDSSSTHEVNALTAIDIRDGSDVTGVSIAYGAVSPGYNTDTTNQSVRVANVGNQVFDTNLYGSNMCDNWGTQYTSCSGNSIPVTNQKWSDAAFDYDTEGTALELQASQVCINNNVPVRIKNDNASGNDPIYFGIGLPSGTPAGSYSGQNTFTTTSSC